MSGDLHSFKEFNLFMEKPCGLIKKKKKSKRCLGYEQLRGCDIKKTKAVILNTMKMIMQQREAAENNRIKV